MSPFHRRPPSTLRRTLAAGLLALIPVVGVVVAAPASPAVAATCPSYTRATDLPLRTCHSGDLVRALQQRLNRANAEQIAVDGYFGPATEQAVRTFQADNGLAVDGIVGPRTWLLVTQLGASCERYLVATTLPMRRCHEGLLVARLQQLLQQTAVGAPPVSGRFGPETMAAVLRFQRVHGLEVDGIVGPVTWWTLHTARG